MERVYRAVPVQKALYTLLRLLLGLLVAACILLSFPKAFADRFNNETSSSTRAQGMGDAAINTERGAYAVFYNPANIAAKETGSTIQLLNMQLEGNDGLFSQAGKAGSINFQSLSSLYNEMKSNPNTFIGGRYSLYPNITLRNFSVGILYEVDQGAEYRASDGALRVKARDRLAPTGAVSYRLFSGILRVGASLQLVTVGNADSVIPQPINPSTLDFKNSITSLMGVVPNAGMTLTFPFRFLPSFSIVGRNLGNVKYFHSPLVSFGDGRTGFTDPMMFDFGTSLTLYMARRLELKLALDYRDLTNKLSGGRFRHVFTGTELIFYDILRFRGGIEHGYLSMGFGINTRRASIDLAVYADELDDRLRGAKDQRYVLQYSWGIFR